MQRRRTVVVRRRHSYNDAVPLLNIAYAWSIFWKMSYTLQGIRLIFFNTANGEASRRSIRVCVCVAYNLDNVQTITGSCKQLSTIATYQLDIFHNSHVYYNNIDIYNYLSVYLQIVRSNFHMNLCMIDFRFFYGHFRLCDVDQFAYTIQKTYQFINVVNGVCHSHKTANIFFSFDSVT